MVTPLSGVWNFPTTVRFGPGRIKELARTCKGLGMTKPLLVTDPGLAKLPMISDALAANQAEGLPTGLFFDVKPNPVGKNVLDGVQAYRRGEHDGVIAWGGGSGLDAAKAIALMVGQDAPLWTFDALGQWKTAKTDGIVPVVAVPTTSGTGSEVGRASVIANEETHTKTVIYHPDMLPKTVICDPELVVGLPADLTAYTGMDALAHCFEAYCVPEYHPMADGIALEGMRLIRDWLPTAVEDGANIEARAHMMTAAAMGSTAFQKGLGAIHALSHPVGALYDTHHGLTNAVMMPYVMDFNRKAIASQMDQLARYLGLAGNGFDAVRTWVMELRQTFGVPHTLAELGVEEGRLDSLSQMAAKDVTIYGNPVKASADELLTVYQAAMKG